MQPRSIVVLTGAGISAESGVATFRDVDGIWSKVRVEDVATPDAFERDPARVHDFYNERRRGLADVHPNAAHDALARLEQAFGSGFLLVTQNIDDLHEQAGSRRLIHMHGELAKAWCVSCDARHDWRGDMGGESDCPNCGKSGGMRPDVVWFGEMPYRMDEIEDAIRSCDLFLSIGTSGTVYPAAGFVQSAAKAGAHTVELNLQTAGWGSNFAEQRRGPATKVVPEIVDELISGRYEGRADRF